jgi:hypothetical protein
MKKIMNLMLFIWQKDKIQRKWYRINYKTKNKTGQVTMILQLDHKKIYFLLKEIIKHKSI